MNLQKFLIVMIVIAAAASLVLLPEIYNGYPFVKKQEIKVDTSDLPKLYPYPLKNENSQEAPEVSAKSTVVIDVKSGVALVEKNPKTRLLPASTTKLMTALVALERCTEDQNVTVTFVEKEPTSMGLTSGDIVSVKSLLYGLLVASGNDAAFALSYSCALNTNQFVAQMNEKSRELGLLDTHFANPAGFDDPSQYTTSSDLARLARVAVANPLIAKIVQTKSTVVTDATGTKTYFLENINELLKNVDGVEGIKTGQTEGSQEVLVTQTTRGEHTIITVVLKSEDRFQDSKNLIEWAFANHTWIVP